MQPRLSIGLPVYNGEDHLGESLEALLGQTYGDFELVISSNASTDATDDICRDYAASDPRIRFFRQPRNVGAAPNHDFVFRKSRGELFKWASGDDLYARDLVEQCVRLLDTHPEAVLAHSWTAAVDEHGTVVQAFEYPLATDSPDPRARLHSMLFGGDDLPGAIRADDFYGIIRADVLRRVKPHGSFHHADQTFMCELALHGRFVQYPGFLYFRRHHAGRAHEANPSIKSWCANLDPRRRGRLHPAARLVAEFAWANLAMVGRAPLSSRDRRSCYAEVARWAADRAIGRATGRPDVVDPRVFGPVDPALVPMRSVVAGQSSGP
jgi:glycosyltransferase involved in cell wall biosynthesis